MPILGFLNHISNISPFLHSLSFCLQFVSSLSKIVHKILLPGFQKLQGEMASGQWTNKLDHMKVEIPSEADHQVMVSGSGSGPGSGPGPGLIRQPSVTRSSCLCSPTTHAGSFRCRLHRSPSLQRTKSMDGSGTAKANSHTIATNDNTTTTAQ